jgi:hypothetical protein
MLALLECLGLGLAWANENIFFAGVFAAEAAFFRRRSALPLMVTST